MNPTLIVWLLAFLAGLVIGAANYTGLWLTVKNLHLCNRPMFAVVSSMMVRTVFCVAIMYLMTREQPQRLVACLAGFFLIRFFSVRYVGKVR